MKGTGVFPILSGMIRNGLVLIVALILSLPLFAQDNSLGVLLGTAEYVDDGVSFDVGLDVMEIWYSRDIDIGTNLRFKLGQADLDVEDDDTALPRGEHEVEYGLVLVEYSFDEIYGSTALFFGPGAYRQSTDAGKDTNFGLSGGVSADFPVTRRIGFIAEAAYHWVNADEEYEFIAVGAGVRLSF